MGLRVFFFFLVGPLLQGSCPVRNADPAVVKDLRLRVHGLGFLGLRMARMLEVRVLWSTPIIATLTSRTENDGKGLGFSVFFPLS